MLINSHGLRQQLYCTYISTQVYILLSDCDSRFGFFLWTDAFCAWQTWHKPAVLVLSIFIEWKHLSHSHGHPSAPPHTHPHPQAHSLLQAVQSFFLTAAHHSTLAQETQRGMESHTLHHLSGMCKQSQKLDLIKGCVCTPPSQTKKACISHYKHCSNLRFGYSPLKICMSVSSYSV